MILVESVITPAVLDALWEVLEAVDDLAALLEGQPK